MCKVRPSESGRCQLLAEPQGFRFYDASTTIACTLPIGIDGATKIAFVMAPLFSSRANCEVRR